MALFDFFIEKSKNIHQNIFKLYWNSIGQCYKILKQMKKSDFIA